MSQTPEFAPAYVSVVNEFPEDLYDAMRHFVCTHPHWDQYRLMQVAVAGFLFQQGSRERAVARHYLDGLFDRGAVATEATATVAPSPVRAAPRPARQVGSQSAGLSLHRAEGAGSSPQSSTPQRQCPAAPSAAAPASSLRPVPPSHSQRPPAPEVSRLAS